ncbi:class I SAM-dependent methyltransferase [Motilimonas pumila]|uniref:Class I SAM-dependent methyltransferase n=1 Tax=Motilimonas pumila TaxID=2303987 RepID=A0A418YDB4_9GAMM|nr:class I SAM-dependent methyltransferase [Motilimonas pumila]RJG42536.1 class I SAM-dependent methyltransferase [Motilimonas pumila]
MKTTLDYYSNHADAFFNATVDIDLQPLYQAFLPFIPPGGNILDAGCGSGRDAKFFQSKGFNVTAMDACPEMAMKASRHLGFGVDLRSFSQIDEVNEYHGIWCCASLLHVPFEELPDILNRMCAALKPGGVLYLSFKYGAGEREKDGRLFTDLNLHRLVDLVDSVPFSIEKSWRTSDLRPKRSHTGMWLNAVLSKDQVIEQKYIPCLTRLTETFMQRL